MKSNLTSDVVDSVINNIDILLTKEIETRNATGESAISEDEAKEVLTVFTEEGKRLRDEILNDVRRNPDMYTVNIEDSLMDISEECLAEYGMAFYFAEKDTIYTRASQPQWLVCIGYAFDLGGNLFDYFKGTKILMNARTTLVIVKAFSKRTLGWIGAAWAAYDYYHCISKK